MAPASADAPVPRAPHRDDAATGGMAVAVLSPSATKAPRSVTHWFSSSMLLARYPRALISYSPAIRPAATLVIATQPLSPWKKPTGRSTVPALKQGWNHRPAVGSSGRDIVTGYRPGRSSASA